MRVELLIVLRKGTPVMGDVVAAINNLKTISGVKVLDSTKLEYKDCNISYTIEKINNKSLVYDVIFTLQKDGDAEIITFEEFIDIYMKVVKAQQGEPKVEVIWNEIKSHYAQEAFPHIVEVENNMRRLISKFMYFQETYDWEQNCVSEKVHSSVRKENTGLSLVDSLDFIDLIGVLFNEYPLKKFYANFKDFDVNSNISYEDIEPYIPKSNWDRYFSRYAKDKRIQKLWKEIYEYRCKVAHSRGLTSNEHLILQSKIKEANQIINDIHSHILEIKLNSEEMVVLQTKRKLKYVTAEYVRPRISNEGGIGDMIKEYYPCLYDHMVESKILFENSGFVTCELEGFRNVIASPLFDVFKPNDSFSYIHIGTFHGNVIEGKESFWFETYEGMCVSLVDESNHIIIAEAMIEEYKDI